MKKIIITAPLAAILFVCILFSCKEEPIVDIHDIALPVITGFSPESGGIGTEITITGKNLQRIDTVYMGEGLAEIKYKINTSQMVVTVTNASGSGRITVSNLRGKATSDNDFHIVYLVPSVAAYPTTGTVNEDIVLEGENFNAIDSILLDDKKASIVSLRPDEIVFKVPFFDTEEPVALKLAYFNGQQNVFTGPEGKTFTVLKEAPLITKTPSSLTKYAPVSILGERLSLIDDIWIDNIKTLIKYKSDTEIIFDMPTNYFGGNMSGVLRATYYKVRELILVDDFLVFADTNEPRYYSHNNVLLSSRIAYGGTEDAFFDAESGIIYHSCAAFDNRKDIDFFLYDQSGYVQLYGPHNGANTIKNFKCEGKTIDPADGSWTDFYGAGGIETKFKVLSRDSANHLPVINAFEDGTIIELTDGLFEDIALPGTSSPRIYKSANDNGYDIASGHISIDKNNIAWVRNNTSGKNGIIRITDMPKEAVNGRIPELKFNIIWAK